MREIRVGQRAQPFGIPLQQRLNAVGGEGRELEPRGMEGGIAHLNGGVWGSAWATAGSAGTVLNTWNKYQSDGKRIMPPRIRANRIRRRVDAGAAEFSTVYLGG